MYSAETTIVDVKQTGESEYTLSMTAKELYVAAQSGDVIRRHDVSASDKAPEKKYVALSGVKFAEATGKYTFTFASGDVMETTSADAYPTASSISDSTDELPTVAAADKGKFLHTNESTGALEWAEGGSGGGVLVVKFAYANGTSTCDHTYAEIDAAVTAGNPVIGCVVDCDGVYRSFRHLNGREGQKARYSLTPGNVYDSSGLKTVKAEIDEDNAVTVTVLEVNI